MVLVSIVHSKSAVLMSLSYQHLTAVHSCEAVIQFVKDAFDLLPNS